MMIFYYVWCNWGDNCIMLVWLNEEVFIVSIGQQIMVYLCNVKGVNVLFVVGGKNIFVCVFCDGKVFEFFVDKFIEQWVFEGLGK